MATTPVPAIPEYISSNPNYFKFEMMNSAVLNS
jgi:hypothetical protein